MKIHPDTTTQCIICGATGFRIDLEDVRLLEGDAATRDGTDGDIIALEVVARWPRCAICSAPRHDIRETDINRIRVRRVHSRLVKATGGETT